MPHIPPTLAQNFAAAIALATTSAARGKALEDFIAALFEAVPGITITRRNTMNTFATEEVDVAFWNDKPSDGFYFLPDVILVECKNWSAKVSSIEVNWFDTKVRLRGSLFGILIALNGITGDSRELTAAHHTISVALSDQRKLIVLRVDELVGLTHSDQLVQLLKVKLCDLTLHGTTV